MKKSILLILLCFAVVIILPVYVHGTYGYVGPGFYLVDNDSGGSTGENGIELIGTGILNRIHPYTPDGYYEAPYENSDTSPIHIELYLPLSDLNGKIIYTSNVNQFYGKIVDSDNDFYDDRFFKIVYLYQYSDIDFDQENITFTRIDLAYYTYTSDSNFFNSEESNAVDVTSLYEAFRYKGDYQVSSSTLGVKPVFEKVHDNVCHLIIPDFNPLDYGFIGGYYS